MSDILYKTECYNIIGACIEVYKDKGHGFLEGVYQECLELELARQSIPFETQKSIEIQYKGTVLKKTYIADLFCHGNIIVELKAASKLAPEHEAQLHNYLKATGKQLGLLVNFGAHPQLEWKRVIRTWINHEKT
jgi:GxxExxY protein